MVIFKIIAFTIIAVVIVKKSTRAGILPPATIFLFSLFGLMFVGFYGMIVSAGAGYLVTLLLGSLSGIGLFKKSDMINVASVFLVENRKKIEEIEKFRKLETKKLKKIFITSINEIYAEANKLENPVKRHKYDYEIAQLRPNFLEGGKKWLNRFSDHLEKKLMEKYLYFLENAIYVNPGIVDKNLFIINKETLPKYFDSNFFDESVDEQKDELSSYAKITGFDNFSRAALNGQDCDAITDSYGLFGRVPENPIPVNGVAGEIKYINRLRCECGVGLLYHRLKSTACDTIQGPIDIYETVCLNGKHWDVLYLHPYHPRRSTWHPTLYTFSDFHPMFSKLAVGYGSNCLDDDFPYGLREPILKSFGGSLGEKIAKRYEKIICDKRKFVVPTSHKEKLHQIK